MNQERKLFLREKPKITEENLTATLTCIGARTSAEDAEYIAQRQNPFRQKRGGLGDGAKAVVSAGGKYRIPKFTNININNEQALLSPLELSVINKETGECILTESTTGFVSKGKILDTPKWGSQILSTGKPAITVLQQHGPKNLVGILGEPRCSLFDKGNACSFCELSGGNANAGRTVEEIDEAYELARQDRKAYGLTLSTGIQSSLGDTGKLVSDVRRIKKSLGTAPLAVEVAPFGEENIGTINKLKEVGLDTLMIPLDCATREAQERYMPGKARMLQENYWNNVRRAVNEFGKGNVTSSIIVGLEPIEETVGAIEKMLEAGVVPEPIPVRWQDAALSRNKGPLPVTDPKMLVAVREALTGYARKIGTNSFSAPKTGCAECGGCGGIRFSDLKKENY